MSPRDSARDVLQSFRDSPWLWLMGGVVMVVLWVTRVESTQRVHTTAIARLDSVKVDRRDLATSSDRTLEELRLIRLNQDSLAARLRDVICEDKPRFCR